MIETIAGKNNIGYKHIVSYFIEFIVLYTVQLLFNFSYDTNVQN